MHGTTPRAGASSPRRHHGVGGHRPLGARPRAPRDRAGPRPGVPHRGRALRVALQHRTSLHHPGRRAALAGAWRHQLPRRAAAALRRAQRDELGDPAGRAHPRRDVAPDRGRRGRGRRRGAAPLRARRAGDGAHPQHPLLRARDRDLRAARRRARPRRGEPAAAGPEPAHLLRPPRPPAGRLRRRLDAAGPPHRRDGASPRLRSLREPGRRAQDRTRGRRAARLRGEARRRQRGRAAGDGARLGRRRARGRDLDRLADLRGRDERRRIGRLARRGPAARDRARDAARAPARGPRPPERDRLGPRSARTLLRPPARGRAPRPVGRGEPRGDRAGPAGAASAAHRRRSGHAGCGARGLARSGRRRRAL